MFKIAKSQKPKDKSQNFNESFSFKIILLIAYCLLPIASKAQCAMCRASLESTGNQTQAEAVNDGIVYLMIIPYVLIGLVGVFIYRMYRKRKAE